LSSQKRKKQTSNGNEGAFKYYVSTFVGMGGLSQNADTADALKGVGRSEPKFLDADILKGRHGIVKTKSKYCYKIIEIIIKLMNFFLNDAVNPSNTALKSQNIFQMIIKKHIIILQMCNKKFSSKSHSVEVLHYQIRGGIRGQGLR